MQFVYIDNSKKAIPLKAAIADIPLTQLDPINTKSFRKGVALCHA